MLAKPANKPDEYNISSYPISTREILTKYVFLCLILPLCNKAMNNHFSNIINQSDFMVQAKQKTHFSLLRNLLSSAKKEDISKNTYKSAYDNMPYHNLHTTYFHNISKPQWSNRNYAKFADEAYSKNVIANRSISLIAKSFSTIKWDLYSSGDKLNKHPILSLLRSPNKQENGKLFLESLMSYRQISGNAFILKVKNNQDEIVELYNLRPDRVSILTDKKGHISSYVYNNGQNEIKYPVDRITGRSDILHIKNFNPLNDHFGLSAVEAAAYSIDQHNNAARWNQSLLQNGAKPSGALVVQNGRDGMAGNLTDEQFIRVKSQIEDQFMGTDNAGRPILLEGGLEWREMSMSPKDMDFIDAKHTAAREIALAFGVPPQLLGIPGDNTYSNLAEARLALWEQTIIPLMEEMVDSFNNWLVPDFKKGQSLEISYDINNIPALLPRREKLWDRVSNADFLSDQEKREMVGLPSRN